MDGSERFKQLTSEQTGRIRRLQRDLKSLWGRFSGFETFPHFSHELDQTDLEDIDAFESVGKGISLFEGLQRDGMELPRPATLDELQSEGKVMEILSSLAEMRIFLIGFDGMSGRKLYRTLWSRTLWEGCYVKKRNPGAITLIDVSRRMQPWEVQQFLDELMKETAVH